MEKLFPITYSKYDLKYDYSLTEDGKVYSHFSKRFLSTRLDKYGYEKVRLISKDNKRHAYSIHRLMLENFSPRNDMDTLQVNHIDGNKLNNHINNLEWATCSENVKHAFNIGLKTQRGENNNSSKLTETQVLEIIDLLLSKKYSGAEIDRMYGLCKDYANSIRRHERWAYLTENIDFS